MWTKKREVDKKKMQNPNLSLDEKSNLSPPIRHQILKFDDAFFKINYRQINS